MKTPKRNALGRGLDSLISMDDTPATGSSAINEIDLDLIQPNPEQPRIDFDEDSLDELATSIRELGIIQPLSLRNAANGTYQIIAGERRYEPPLWPGSNQCRPIYARQAKASSPKWPLSRIYSARTSTPSKSP